MLICYTSAYYQTKLLTLYLMLNRIYIVYMMLNFIPE